MSHAIQTDKYEAITVDALPSECPQCHNKIAAVRQSTVLWSDALQWQVVFSCPSCKALFIAYYREYQYVEENVLSALLPQAPPANSFGLLDSLSPLGITTYNQASAAESYGLNEIAGMGYRKALEFFVKDFCIAEHPADADAIRKQHKLGIVIDKYVDDRKLQAAAKMTAWLGNDETHYERRWTDKDIKDLKNLLRITIGSINEALEFATYKAQMMPAQTAKP